MLMEAGNRNDDPLGASRKLLRHAFKFDAIDAEYHDYIESFESIPRRRSWTRRPADDELCFLLRTLLIHRLPADLAASNPSCRWNYCLPIASVTTRV